MPTDVSRSRTSADRADFVAYRTVCPVCGVAVGPRHVTREHADVPPDPPYAASVVCPARHAFEVVFTS